MSAQLLSVTTEGLEWSPLAHQETDGYPVRQRALLATRLTMWSGLRGQVPTCFHRVGHNVTSTRVASENVSATPQGHCATSRGQMHSYSLFFCVTSNPEFARTYRCDAGTYSIGCQLHMSPQVHLTCERYWESLETHFYWCRRAYVSIITSLVKKN